VSGIEVWLAVRSDDIRVGTLYSHRHGKTESATFMYDDTYLAARDAYAIDPTLPLVSGSIQTPVGKAMFNAFGDASPDRWGRTMVKRQRRIQAREIGRAPADIGEVDYLLGVRDDLRQGALRLRILPDGPFVASEVLGVPALADLADLLNLADKAESDELTGQEIARLVQAGSSLGGMRPKAHVQKPDGSAAIAKFPSKSIDTWNVMAWEKVAHDLAQTAGIDVPNAELIALAGRSVLIVDRFDRGSDGERIGYASALTMLEGTDGDQRSYLEIAEVIERVSPHATQDLHQLWRRMAFSILVSNTDDHLRNHGFLHHHASSWTLAPAFDINPNPALGTKYLSTAIDEADTLASIETLMRVSGYFRLGTSDAEQILSEVHEAVAGWRTKAIEHGLTRRDIDEMEPAFEHNQQDAAAALR